MDGRWFGRLLSWYPPYWGTGIRVRMAADYSVAEVRMALRFYNRNYFGTHFGGSLYSMVDPIYVLMLANRLGRGYSVWDQAATIEFVRPGRGVVRARFEVGDEQLEEVRAATAGGETYRPVWPVKVIDGDEKVVARVSKTLYIRRRSREGSGDKLGARSATGEEATDE
jgi:acyl-coenzyme A thioesterase PaaI-like protein